MHPALCSACLCGHAPASHDEPATGQAQQPGHTSTTKTCPSMQVCFAGASMAQVRRPGCTFVIREMPGLEVALQPQVAAQASSSAPRVRGSRLWCLFFDPPL